MQAFPAAVVSIAGRMRALPDVPALDQLTVNEYPPGVGLAPHIDTHSAFTGDCLKGAAECQMQGWLRASAPCWDWQ